MSDLQGNPTEEGRNVYTLLDLTNSLRSVIQKTYHSAYWIKAEIAKLNLYPKSGHCYPDLLQKEGNSIQAEMRATLWADTYRYYNQRFLAETKSPLQDGMAILFKAKVTFHPVYGLSLNIMEIEPAFTLGEMAREKMQTIDQLKQEGIFEQNKLLPLPLLPQRLAVISVETSKGYSDFLKIIEPNAWGYPFFHHLFPALLQGDKAVASILGQLRLIKKVQQHFDVALIIRGGGGDVGMNCYDHYELAKEVALFPIPVITGIGHSTNETVVEMTAFQNKITPTDVGYYLLQQFHNYVGRLEDLERRMVDQAEDQLQEARSWLDRLTQQISIQAIRRTEREQYRLNTLNWEVQTAAKSYLSNVRQNLFELTAGLKYTPKQRVQQAHQSLDNLSQRLARQSKQVLQQSSNHLSRLSEKLQLLKPENVLQRGYSITWQDGKVVKDASTLKEGDTITTALHQGEIISTVKNIKQQ